MSERNYSIETKALHAGTAPDPVTGSRAVPIHQTTSFQFKNTEHAANLFGLKEFGNIYTRLMNPTNDVVEQRLAALEGGAAGLVTSSGQAASSFAVMNLAGAGDHIICSTGVYGGTYNLFHYTLPKYGIDATFVDPDDLDGVAKAIRPNTKAIYGETVGNPRLNLYPIEATAKIAHAHGLPLIVDNTAATPYLVRPIEWGADIVVHSTTKYIGGHGTTIGGAVIDAHKFDWRNSARHSPFYGTPDHSYHGLVFGDLAGMGLPPYILRMRLTLLRDIGASQAPISSWFNVLGLETLHVRMDRHIANAAAVAKHLVAHPKVAWVNHPTLPNYKWQAEAMRVAPKGLTALIGFGIKGGREAGKNFINSLKLLSHVANIGDAKSLAIHPASTTHSQLSPAEQLSTGVSDDFIRLSIGIEAVDDIVWDIDQALAQA